MASAADIGKQIGTFRAMQDIVGAMKAYAGVALRKTEQSVLTSREYERELLGAIRDLTAHVPPSPRESKGGGRRLLVAFGSTQGLCGAFNEKAAEAVRDAVTASDTLFVVGGRLRGVLEGAGIRYGGFMESAVSVEGIHDMLRTLASNITGIYGASEYDSLAMVFTSVADNQAGLSVERVLPPEAAAASPGFPPLMYLAPQAVFEGLLDEFLYISLYRCCAESLRSENWYRLRSMEGASKNLEKHISALESAQNYVRQEEVTEEMLEILGGGMFYKRQ